MENQLTKHFRSHEFACGCCGKVLMDVGFLAQLERARCEAGIPFQISSGYRCHDHNAAVGGKADSTHVKGMAVDIRITNSFSRFAVVSGCISAGFTRIGVADHFVHVDLDPIKPKKLMWVY